MKPLTTHEEFCLKNAAHFVAARGRTPATRTREQFAMVPFKAQRDRRPSVFMWPISGSIALRRRRSAISFGVRPRLVPLIRTRVLVST